MFYFVLNRPFNAEAVAEGRDELVVQAWERQTRQLRDTLRCDFHGGSWYIRTIAWNQDGNKLWTYMGE